MLELKIRLCPICEKASDKEIEVVEQCEKVNRIRCTHCEAIYFDREPPEEPRYDLAYNLFFNRPSDARKAGIMAERLALLAKANFKDPHILEVGPGNGLTTFLLQNLGFRVEALDVDLDFCQHLIRKLRITVWPGKFETATLWHGFNLIYASHVIEHCENPLFFFEKASLIMPIGGILYIDTPCTDLIGTQGKKWKHFRTRGIYEHCCLFSQKTIQYVAALRGFEIEEKEIFTAYQSAQYVLRKINDGTFSH